MAWVLTSITQIYAASQTQRDAIINDMNYAIQLLPATLTHNIDTIIIKITRIISNIELRAAPPTSILSHTHTT